MDIKVNFGNTEYNVEIEKKGDKYRCKIGDNTFNTQFQFIGKNEIVMNLGNSDIVSEFIQDRDKTIVYIDGERYEFKEKEETKGKEENETQENIIKAPMPGLIVKVDAKKGDKIKKGDILVILEAMKMQHEFKSKGDMLVKDVFVKEGEQVEAFATLVELSPIK